MTGAVLPGLSAAGRALPAALLAALPGLVFAAGYDHLAYGLGLLAGVVLAGLLVAPRLAEAESPAIPSALGETFGAVAAVVAAALLAIVAVPLLVAELALVGLISEHALGVAPHVTIPVAAGLVMAAALVCNARTLAVLSALAWLLLALSLVIPLTLIAVKAEGGLTFPLTAYGLLLPDLQGIEETLIERGLVDFDTFSAHAAPFIRLMERDVLALVVTLALGVAALPHLAGALARGREPGAARLAGAWAALFAMILLISVPALAVYAKHAIFSAVAGAIPLPALPAWLEAPLGSGLAHVHGTSLHLFEEVISAARAGARDAAAVGDALTAAAAIRWQALDANVQQVMYAAAAHHLVDPQSTSAWEIYRGTVLPAAAAAAGNESAALTQSGLAVEPWGLLLVVAGLTGFPRAMTLLLALAGTVAASIMAASLIRAVAGGTLDRTPGGAPTAVGAGLALSVGLIAAALAVLSRIDPVTGVVSGLALAGAGLFPALSLGLAWRRATAAGVVAAMIAGASITGYYMAGTQLFPATFYATWPALSDAGDHAIEEFEMLAAEARDAASEEERGAARSALDDLARGSATRMGLANWGGVDSASSGVFGALGGLLVLVVVSLLTPSRRRPKP